MHDLILAQRHLESAERFGEDGWVSDDRIDSTRPKVFGKGEWQLERHGGHAHRSWRKLHLAVDPDSGEILALDLTNNEEGDASLVGPLLDRIARQVGMVPANGADGGEPVCGAVAAHSPAAEVIIPPRPRAVPSATVGSTPTQRDRHIQLITERSW